MERNVAQVMPVLGMISISLLAACGTSTNTTAPSASAGGGALSSCTGAVTVASDLPTSGSDASDGKPTQNGVQLAIDQANSSHLLGGCTVKYVPKDDSSVALGKHDPQQGASNITGLAGDPAVVGVVGPFNSSVALNEMPIANQANLVMISPANTNPGLTIVGSNPDINTASLRPTGVITYFRVCTTDIGQGKGLASVAIDKLQAKMAFVIDDQETYGKGLADQFTKFYTAAGGTVTKRVSLPGTTKDFRAQLTEAKNDGSTLVFFGGTSSNGGGIIRKQMADLNITAKFEGGDGIVDDEFFTEAGSAGDGSYGTIAAPDPTKLASAAKFVSDYKAAFSA
ncbi:MAG TPA: branched-chain amino acid ABC transporter substrate-binding protein, partial [Candidatus Dormibacteraeota bacterium]|nr:branched-chain amino acid ABC transporter substrate-binding protein [Candidatus Dormibacteraeota bacterium]